MQEGLEEDRALGEADQGALQQLDPPGHEVGGALLLAENVNVPCSLECVRVVYVKFRSIDR